MDAHFYENTVGADSLGPFWSDNMATSTIRKHWSVMSTGRQGEGMSGAATLTRNGGGKHCQNWFWSCVRRNLLKLLLKMICRWEKSLKLLYK